MAFAEITSLKKTLSIVSASRAIESFKSSIDQIRNELCVGMSPAEAAQLLGNLADAVMSDLNTLAEAAETDLVCLGDSATI